ncbi:MULTISPECIES: ribulose-phosphate 3-epimerase [unclassified Lactobacillus]|uniref:ribulose-phosphate 3-epimerase n=1 Tax=unclassified Lactobacillus TaxID=2620435 RepID=UPI000EFD4D9B|nr:MULTISPECIES: ribulose-phosphate 3-epimerase [unclassified Lactobacillus]RMC39522.1 ribulose-phosphate 3-epimerase [Lactobacillus sp. ESL0237]RMC43586.1 ribulose-phosphate 3-epimerase [Lactobacillus sp. ESL0234]RMC45068.1 ribulose-phosphate 3-epimerase [Lactobacillus sp. ESL0236]RMC46668.1 ribulose-phosphate 3-epimerase [Lactobacillus sp. ESL0230]
MMIAPSILNINNLDLKNDIQVAAQAGIKRFHIDIMDGHFVPNLSFGPQVVSDFKKTFPKLEAEVHLMSNKPEIMVPAFVKAGADLMLLHYEAMDTAELNKWIDYLKQHQVRVGLVLNPDTPLTVLPPFIPKIDQLLIMTVYPGFGGQKFIAESCEKIRQAKVMLASKIPVEVDGGINRQTAKLAQEAGAEIFVAGSYLFCQESVVAQINELDRILK